MQFESHKPTQVNQGELSQSTYGNILSDDVIMQRTRNPANQLFTLSNEDILLCLEYMKKGGNTGSKARATMKRTFPILKKDLRHKKIDLVGLMESLRFDQQKALFQKEEIEEYYLGQHRKMRSCFDEIRRKLAEKEALLQEVLSTRLKGSLKVINSKIKKLGKF